MLIFIFLNQCDTVFSFPIAIEEDDKTEYYVLGALAVVGTLAFMIGLCSFTSRKKKKKMSDVEMEGNEAFAEVRKSSSRDGSRITSIVNENYNPAADPGEETIGSVSTAPARLDTMVIHGSNSIEPASENTENNSSKSEDAITVVLEPQPTVDSLKSHNEEPLKEIVSENQLKMVDKMFKSKLDDSSNSSSIEVIEDVGKNRNVVVERRSVDMDDTLKEIMDELQIPNVDGTNIKPMLEEDFQKPLEIPLTVTTMTNDSYEDKNSKTRGASGQEKNVIETLKEASEDIKDDGVRNPVEGLPLKTEKTFILSAMKSGQTSEEEKKDKTEIKNTDNLDGIRIEKSEQESNKKANILKEETTEDILKVRSEKIRKEVSGKSEKVSLLSAMQSEIISEQNVEGSTDSIKDDKGKDEIKNDLESKDFQREENVQKNTIQERSEKLPLLKVMQKEVEVIHDKSSLTTKSEKQNEKIESPKVKDRVQSQKFVTNFRNSKY